MVVASIPSPSTGVWELGPFPLRAYALCIIAGIIAAVWIGDRRFRARGGAPHVVADVAIWAVPFGIVGGRLYHVVTSWDPYFGPDGEPIRALYVWQGGLGIWGAVALGGVGAWIGCRLKHVPFLVFADAVAPGIAVAQALGRWGNWFNQELYGRPTDVPWALEIDRAHRPEDSLSEATYHPTFLYESLWNLGVAVAVILVDRRFRLGHGRVFALYVALYTVGRGGIETLRVDEAHEILGLRLNVWTSVVVFLGALAFFVFSARRWPGREELHAPGPPAVAAVAEADPLPEPEPEPAAEAELEPELEPDAETDPEPDPEPVDAPEPESQQDPYWR